MWDGTLLMTTFFISEVALLFKEHPGVLGPGAGTTLAAGSGASSSAPRVDWAIQKAVSPGNRHPRSCARGQETRAAPGWDLPINRWPTIIGLSFFLWFVTNEIRSSDENAEISQVESSPSLDPQIRPASVCVLFECVPQKGFTEVSRAYSIYSLRIFVWLQGNNSGGESAWNA